MPTPLTSLRLSVVAAVVVSLGADGRAHLAAQAVVAGQDAAFDVVLAGGRVVDGTGAPWYVADVGVRGDRIARIGDLRNVTAATRIDACGLVVAPGFIDPHVHARDRLFELPNAEGYLLQGLTTVVDGNDGSSPLPLGPYFARLQAATMSPNVALFVGHGTVRASVMGTANRLATPEEVVKMQALVAAAMRDGALGLSTGLAYAPGTYASTDEIVALARTAREHGGIYISHMRDEGGGVLDSVRETISIGERAQIPVQISHHKVGGRKQFGQSVQSLDHIAAARRRGVDVTFDQYPYTASQTGLSLIFPRWALADDALNERLASAGQRREIKTGMLSFIDERFGDDPSRIQLVRCDHDPLLAGKTIKDLLTAASLPLTQSAMADMVIELQLKGGCSAIFHAYDEPDVERLMQSPFGMIGSDGSLTTPGEGAPHPRAFGTYPRVLGRYVRERALLTLEDAIRKMTSFPAARLGFTERGVLKVGMMADITVFDA
ncbi:MAG TPA: D-aminoacylase, partial [Vicinamibacterales bacterium]|nr:D-aminoacylase [Vicinamibacterales bacterium]